MFLIYITSTEEKLSDNGEWIQLPLTTKKLHNVFSSLLDNFESGYTVTKIITNYDWLNINIGDFGTPSCFNIFALNGCIRKIDKLNEEEIIIFKKFLNEGKSIITSLDYLEKPNAKKYKSTIYETTTFKVINAFDYIDKNNKPKRWID